MKLHFDWEFFPALRQVQDQTKALRERNEQRLAQAKSRDGNYYRPKEQENEREQRTP
jgi:hypothetical protein